MGFFDSLFGKKVEEKSVEVSKPVHKPSLEAIIGVNYKNVPTPDFESYQETRSDGSIVTISECKYDTKIVGLFNHIKVLDFGDLENKKAKNIILTGDCKSLDIKSLNYMIMDLVYKFGQDKDNKGALTTSEKHELRDNFGDEDVSRWWEDKNDDVKSIMLNIYPDDDELSFAIHYQENGWLEAYKRAGGK